MTKSEFKNQIKADTIRFLCNQVKSNRKLTLFAVACCKEVKHLMKDARSLAAIKSCKEFADGLISRELMLIASTAAYAAYAAASAAASAAAYAAYAAYAAAYAAYAAAYAAYAASSAAYAASTATAAYATATYRNIFEDICRNSFVITKIDPRWLTSNVVDLAGAIYIEENFSIMPILADALMDAGCDDEDIIANCRSGDRHYLGNWVVDLILDKK